MLKRTGLLWVCVGFCLVSPVMAQDSCRLDWVLEETLRIGSLDGEDALSSFSSVAVAEDGTIYIPQITRGSVLVFSSTGELLRTIGRDGSGPGDFEFGPRIVDWVAGELWVADRSRAQSFGPDGSPREFVSFRTWIEEEASTYRPQAPLADGSFWATRSVSPVPGASQPSALALRRWSRDGDPIDTVAVLDVSGARVVLDERGGFTLHPLGAMLPGKGIGGLGQVVSGDRSNVWLLGETRPNEGSFDLLRLAITGDTVLKRAVPYEARPIDRAERRWWFDEFSAVTAGDSSLGRPRFRQVPEAERNRARARARGAFWMPDYYPPVRRILAGEDGTVWLLREPDVLQPADRWEVYDATGSLVGRWSDEGGRARYTPWLPRLNLLSASAEEVWATTMDGLDVPYLHRFRVDRGCEG